jgi:hypothetical protein
MLVKQATIEGNGFMIFLVIGMHQMESSMLLKLRE